MPPVIGKYFLRLRTSSRTSSEILRYRGATAGTMVVSASAGASDSRSAGLDSSSSSGRSDSTNDVVHRCLGGGGVGPPALGLLGCVQPATGTAIRAADLDQAGLGQAAVPVVGAARLELATGRHPERVRDDARDRRQRLAALLLAGDRIEEALGIGMLWRQQHLVDGAGFDDAPRVHH